MVVFIMVVEHHHTETSFNILWDWLTGKISATPTSAEFVKPSGADPGSGNESHTQGTGSGHGWTTKTHNHGNDLGKHQSKKGGFLKRFSRSSTMGEKSSSSSGTERNFFGFKKKPTNGSKQWFSRPRSKRGFESVDLLPMIAIRTKINSSDISGFL
jgi:hypothetical protein